MRVLPYVDRNFHYNVTSTVLVGHIKRHFDCKANNKKEFSSDRRQLN